ncbi:MAG TPA: RagB/SusD family nutrient uptake outer membrane protein [Saprospiraceae bacterium]|nr:RagB/SusD family nutrient uptake outer membrane protein [Saprospiraceae bacterium]HMP24988.1 RagB/SusD family nutrient uptake outer membrane protein [Saprospiraceae bacterium]
MKNNLLKILALIVTLQFFSACEKNLELDPFTALDATAGFTTKQDVEAALLGCYSAVQSGNYYGLRMWAMGDVYTGTLTHTGTFPSFAQFANRNILANNAESNAIWNTVYIAINRANNVIASAPGVNDPSFNVNNAVAEARFLRAFHYFNLLSVFGGSPSGFNQGGVGIPIFTTPTLSAADAAPRPRVSEAETWTQILDDLNFALQNLNANNGIGRINTNVANAFKARVHLARGEWAEAEAAAAAVISQTRYALVPDFENIFRTKNSSETVWELQFDANNTNAIAFFYYPTAQGGRNEITSSNALRDLHEPGDLRLPVNVTITVPLNKTLKYTSVPGEDNVQIFRLAEMYLIRAEAAARLNKGEAALADLNIIRERAGLDPLELEDANEIVDAVLRERIIEFAHEGLRWFDVRRTGRLESIGLTQPFRALWPIPEREVDTSAGVITQNSGY